MPPLYREHAAAAPLARWVECCWTSETREAVAGYPVRPDGCLDVLYSREDGLRIVGAMSVEQRYDLPPGAHAAGVRFQPGMAGSLLRAAPGELTDRVVAAGGLWAARARSLEGRLQDAEPAAWAGILLDELPEPAPLNAVQRAIEFMVQWRGVVDLEWTARQSNLSVRQFRRRCLEESGLTPKRLCRVLRFRHACRLAQNPDRPEWAAIAVEAGFFDQAHLIRDFREFAGSTPVSVFSNPLIRPFV